MPEPKSSGYCAQNHLGFEYVIVAKYHKSAHCAAVFAHYVEIDMRVKHTIASGAAALYNERARS